MNPAKDPPAGTSKNPKEKKPPPSSSSSSSSSSDEEGDEKERRRSAKRATPSPQGKSEVPPPSTFEALSPKGLYERDLLTLARLMQAGALSEGMLRWMAMYLRLQEAEVEGKPLSTDDLTALEFASKSIITLPPATRLKRSVGQHRSLTATGKEVQPEKRLRSRSLSESPRKEKQTRTTSPPKTIEELPFMSVNLARRARALQTLHLSDDITIPDTTHLSSFRQPADEKYELHPKWMSFRPRYDDSLIKKLRKIQRVRTGDTTYQACHSLLGAVVQDKNPYGAPREEPKYGVWKNPYYFTYRIN